MKYRAANVAHHGNLFLNQGALYEALRLRRQEVCSMSKATYRKPSREVVCSRGVDPPTTRTGISGFRYGRQRNTKRRENASLLCVSITAQPGCSVHSFSRSRHWERKPQQRHLSPLHARQRTDFESDFAQCNRSCAIGAPNLAAVGSPDKCAAFAEMGGFLYALRRVACRWKALHSDLLRLAR